LAFVHEKQVLEWKGELAKMVVYSFRKGVNKYL